MTAGTVVSDKRGVMAVAAMAVAAMEVAAMEVVVAVRTAFARFSVLPLAARREIIATCDTWRAGSRCLLPTDVRPLTPLTVPRRGITRGVCAGTSFPRVALLEIAANSVTSAREDLRLMQQHLSSSICFLELVRVTRKSKSADHAESTPRKRVNTKR
jgi:hypothetical protein